MYNFFRTDSKKKLITTIIILILILNIIGILNLLSLASPESLKNTLGLSHVSIIGKHLKYLIGTFASMFIITLFLNVNKLNKLTIFIMFFIVFGLIYTLVAGKSVNGARRWIGFGSFTIQFSEFAKLFLILVLAYMIERAYYIKKERLNIYIYTGLYTMFCAGLILISRSFSATVQFVLIFICMYWVSEVISYKKIIFTVICLGFSGVVAIFSKGYRISRLNLENEHALLSMKSISNGGFFGSGYGNGISRNFYLPEVQTDYIFAGFVDEWGFIGAIVLITLFILLIYFIFYSAKFANSVYEKMIIYGVGFMIANQFILHIGINVNLLPSTGVTLPFLSAGGSSMLTVGIGLGFILSIILSMNDKLEEGVIYE
ncbi:FtsW/RodA/SpoVE family cell cycle protein [Streptobacillus moniliformis]|uniref:FtsW/RodA/SpoVE family cell cycle protein n=1 Tax=Streptobacillus moniliformis TaxID=34105 RepID=UPI0007E3E795|nr:FtsW/RodA/SpoVE family cell cycle protein [Streptobacillus moniliformis]